MRSIFDWLVRKWEQAWVQREDLGFVSRAKMVDIDARVRRNVVRDKKGGEWPMRNALVVALLLLCTPAFADSARFRAFKQWSYHYQHEMGLDAMHLTFVHYNHPDWCAWVKKDKRRPTEIEVGMSEPDWECLHRTPRELALHEMCHLRLHHLDFGVELTDEEKHAEVRKCISDYWRERE